MLWSINLNELWHFGHNRQQCMHGTLCIRHWAKAGGQETELRVQNFFQGVIFSFKCLIHSIMKFDLSIFRCKMSDVSFVFIHDQQCTIAHNCTMQPLHKLIADTEQQC